jgi:hypothetical protein
VTRSENKTKLSASTVTVQEAPVTPGFWGQWPVAWAAPQQLSLRDQRESSEQPWFPQCPHLNAKCLGLFCGSVFLSRACCNTKKDEMGTRKDSLWLYKISWITDDMKFPISWGSNLPQVTLQTCRAPRYTVVLGASPWPLPIIIWQVWDLR